jgi:hypothetical protein
MQRWVPFVECKTGQTELLERGRVNELRTEVLNIPSPCRLEARPAVWEAGGAFLLIRFLFIHPMFLL